MPAKDRPPIRNRLLANLPAGELDRLKPRLEEVELALNRTLLSAGAPIGHVYFVQRGVVSLVRSMEDGSMVEVGLVGREGLAGIEAVLGGATNTVDKVVQVAGSALRISVRALREQIAQSKTLTAQLHRYAQAVLIQISQNAACNGRHALQERLARRLLMAHDRVEENVIPLSHEILAMTLGSRRPGITVTLGTLKDAGLIHNSHGKITILDRPGLEAAACECYGTVEKGIRRLFP
jgi:CRP-like cAMP-binding protein